mgnify:CR=1 FL=1
MSKNYLISRGQMAECARDLVNLPARVWTFTGTLGAGKTTLVQEMLAVLGVVGPIQSPTYTYVTVYPLPDGKHLYHFDLYRLSSHDEFIQAGFDEYLYDEQALCFIEWPEIIKDALPSGTICVSLAYAPDEKRAIVVE